MKIFLIVATFLVLGLVEGRVREHGNHVKNYMKLSNKTPKDTFRISVHTADRSTSDTLCDECKSEVGELDSILKDKALMGEIEEGFKLFCDVLPSSYKPKCLEIANELPGYVAMLEPLLSNPQAFCQEIGFCGSGQRQHNHISLKTLKILFLFAKKYQATTESSALCDECKFAATELKTLIDDKSIQQEIEQGLKSICAMVASIKDECDALVDQFFPTLVQELDQLLSDPEAACEAVGLCSGVASRLLSLNGFETSPIRGHSAPNAQNRLERFMFMLNRLHTGNGVKTSCVLCKFGVKTVANALEEPEVMSELTNKLKDLCGILPSVFVKNGCEDFIQTYGQPVIILTGKELASIAREVCNDIGACNSNDLGIVNENAEDEEWVSSETCDGCKTLVGFLESECRQPSFQKAVADEAKKLCDIMPNSVTVSCDNIMDQYVPYLLQLLTQNLTPTEICTDIKLCSETTDSMELEIEENEVF